MIMRPADETRKVSKLNFFKKASKKKKNNSSHWKKQVKWSFTYLLHFFKSQISDTIKSSPIPFTLGKLAIITRSKMYLFWEAIWRAQICFLLDVLHIKTKEICSSLWFWRYIFNLRLRNRVIAQDPSLGRVLITNALLILMEPLGKIGKWRGKNFTLELEN